MTMVNRAVSADDSFQLPIEVRTALKTTFAPVGAISANTRRLMQKLYAGKEDAALLVIGDSTGVPTYRWVYLATQRLAAQFPAYTVIYHLWDPTGLAAYDTGTSATPVTIQTGTGAQTLHVWNFSVSGQSTWFGLAGRYPAAINAVDPDLIIVSHGKNEQFATLPTTLFAQSMWRGQMLALTERVRVTHPDAGMLVTLQPLNLTDAAMTYRNRVYTSVAQERGYGILNVDGAFLATGHPNDFIKPLPGDGIHPTDAGDPYDGSALWADVVMSALRYDPTAPVATVSQQQSALLTEATQQLPNGSFAAFTGSVPDSWTAVNATVTKDTRTDWIDPENGYGVRVVAASAGASYLQNLSIPVDRYRGRWVTLRVRMKIAAAALTAGAARISLTDSVGVMTTTTKSTAVDGFFDQVVSLKVSPTAPYLRVIIYADSGANAAADVTVARADLVLGALPKTATSVAAGALGPAGPAGPTSPADLDFMSTCGTDPVLFLLVSAGSYAASAANAPIEMKFRPSRDVLVQTLQWMTGSVSSGNYDIAILSATGTRLWSTGSKPWPAASTLAVETVSSPIAMTAGTTYWLVFCADNTTGLFRGQAKAFTNQVRSVTGEFLSKSGASGNFPIPSSLPITVPGADASRWPAISIHGT